MTERSATVPDVDSDTDTDTDDITRHPDYLPEPDFYDDDNGPEDQAPDPAEDDDGS